MKYFTISKGLVLMTFILLSACGESDSGDGRDNDDVKSSLGDSCTKTADCEDGLHCRELVCVDDTTDPDGDAIDGDVSDGDATDGDVIDGDMTDGDAIDGDTIDGDLPDGDISDGDTSDGDDPLDGDVQADGDSPDGDLPDGDISDGDLTEGENHSGPAPGAIGAPCTHITAQQDCDSDWCLDKNSISPLLPDYEGEIEGGYCSVLLCQTDGSDNMCTEAMQAYCFSLYPFAGDTFATLGLCARTCSSVADCRPTDDQICFDTTALVDAGMAQALYDQYYPGDPKLCMPASLAQAALDAIGSADGDQADGDYPSCSGSCNVNSDTTSCVGDDLCICENGNWTFYTCDAVCDGDGKISDGCGDAGLAFDYCICVDVSTDGDEEVDIDDDCTGSCNPENTPFVCIDDMNLCTCDENGALETLNCEEICIEAGYSGATECGANPDSGMDTCWCYMAECASDADCIAKGMDYCVSLGDSTICANRCNLNLCYSTVACMNVGVGEGCGICFEQGQPACATSGEDCSAGTDGSQYCSDLCDLTTKSCYDACEAAPNSCAAGELCFPFAGDAQGTIVDGVCIDYGADCPYCTGADGDVDGDIDWDVDTDMEK